jgi:hypothetical protein
MQVCVLPHAEQDAALAERMAKLSRPPANSETPQPTRRPTDPGQRATGTPPTVDAPDPPTPASPPAVLAGDTSLPKA